MCGINGIFGLYDKEQRENIIRLMNQRLIHRGPDDEGIFSTPQITLGHRRLSIIDLSPAGHQPMTSSDGRYTIVHNGEIYNFKEIRRNQLKEYSFHSDTDTEVILAAYQKWGANCLQYFNGMFVFAVWDNLGKKLFIARDRIGKKPLYYCKQNNSFVFSSEIRALLASKIVSRKINPDALIDYLRYQTVHAPQTILQNVFMLLPGNYLLISENEFIEKKYWNISSIRTHTPANKPYSEICNIVRNLFFQSVEKRLIADVPLGAFLSGGIDSSAVVAVMSQLMKEKVKTFSVVFDEEKFSETKYSLLVARRFNTEHHEIHLKVSDFLNELPNALSALDHPSGDGPNTFVVSKVTKKAGLTVALSGLGGDELFCGYNIFKRTAFLQRKKIFEKIPLAIRKLISSLLKNTYKSVGSYKLSKLLENESFEYKMIYYLFRQVLLDEQIREIVNTESLSANSVSCIVENLFPPCKGGAGGFAFQENNFHFLLSHVSMVEISTYMQNVLLRDTDQMSMAHALEVRTPFLDHELVELILSLPDKYKYPSTPKKLLIDSLSGLLPDEVIHRPKMGFLFPWKMWLRNELRTFAGEKINSLSGRKYFNKKGVKQLWHSFIKGDKRVTWSRVWHLIVLEDWLQRNDVNE